MLPASAVPLIAGVGLLIDPEVAIVGDAITVSTSIFTGVDDDVFPAASVALTEKAYVPSDREMDGVNE